jgi:putative transposase
VARTHGITDQTIYRWREKYAGMTAIELAEMKALYKGNRRLRYVVAQLNLDLASTKKTAKGNW